MTNKTGGARSANTGDVINGLILFLAINFLVAAMYFKVLNP